MPGRVTCAASPLTSTQCVTHPVCSYQNKRASSFNKRGKDALCRARFAERQQKGGTRIAPVPHWARRALRPCARPSAGTSGSTQRSCQRRTTLPAPSGTRRHRAARRQGHRAAGAAFFGMKTLPHKTQRLSTSTPHVFVHNHHVVSVACCTRLREKVQQVKDTARSGTRAPPSPPGGVTC